MITPYFSTIQEFFQMGEHGVYVWSCYALVFATIFSLIFYARRERKMTLSQLNRQQKMRLTNKQRQNKT